MFPAFKTVLVPDYSVPPVPPPCPPRQVILIEDQEERRENRRKKFSTSYRKFLRSAPEGGGPGAPGLPPTQSSQGTPATQFGFSYNPADYQDEEPFTLTEYRPSGTRRVEELASTGSTQLRQSNPSEYWQNSQVLGSGSMEIDDDDELYVSPTPSNTPIRLLARSARPSPMVVGITPSRTPLTPRVLRLMDSSPVVLPRQSRVIRETPLRRPMMSPPALKKFKFSKMKFKR